MKYKIAVKSTNNEIRKLLRPASDFRDAAHIAASWIRELHATTEQTWEIVEVCKIPDHNANNPFTGTW